MKTAAILCLMITAAGCASREPGSRRPQGPPERSVVAETFGARGEAPVAPPATVAPPTTPPAPAEQPAAGPREVFPFVRVDARAKVVEIEGQVPIDAHDPQAPNVYLEVVVCTPNTKEHETLVVTQARPSHVHAALLSIGLMAGKPGSWDFDGQKLLSFPPEGSAVEVTIAYRDAAGNDVEARAGEWIINAQDGRSILAAGAPAPFVFAGSVLATRGGREVYDADGTGTLVGLATFGTETVAWRQVISHEAAVMEPEWIANPRLVPRYGTPVVVRFRGVP